MAADELLVQVDGRSVRVSSANRVVFPEIGARKGDVARYYQQVGDRLLAAIGDRPTTLERWPRGVLPGMSLGEDGFYQKRIPRGAPAWVDSVDITFPSGRAAREVCPTSAAVAVWAAQFGTITFHPWPVRATDVEHPDEFRLDLDPQPGTDIADAVLVARAARNLLTELGVRCFVKTSGGRGLHLTVRIAPSWDFVQVRHAAIGVARELERRLPDLVTSAWWKEERGRRIFIDYNQMAKDRTMASAYSIRATPTATVSTPIDWGELDGVDPAKFTIATVPARLDSPDPWAELEDRAFDLQPVLALFEADLDRGLGDLPYPPDYPKMPGEPKRVQPSRARDSGSAEEGPKPR
jgi:DNA ligase D